MIDVNSNDLKLAKETVEKIRRTMPKAYYAAVQRAGQMTKTHASRLVRQKYHVKAKEINERVTLRRGSASNPFVELRAKGRNIPVIKFRANPNKPQIGVQRVRPVRVAVKRTGLKPVDGAFIARVGKGEHTGVFKRVGRRRLPIQEVYGPAVPVMMGQPETLNELADFACEKFQQRLDHEINRRLGDVLK